MKRTLPWLHNHCIHKKKNFKLTLNLWEDKIDLTRGFGESNFYKYMKYKIWFITVAHLTLYGITKWISSFNKHLLNSISASHYVFLVHFEVLKKSTFIIRRLLANLKKIVLRCWSLDMFFSWAFLFLPDALRIKILCHFSHVLLVTYFVTNRLYY